MEKLIDILDRLSMEEIDINELSILDIVVPFSDGLEDCLQ